MRQFLSIGIVSILLLTTFVSAQGETVAENQSIETHEEYDLKLGFLEKRITVKNSDKSVEVVSNTDVPRFFSPAIDYSETPGNEHEKMFMKTVEWSDELGEGEQKVYTVSFAYWRVLLLLFAAGVTGYGVRKHRHHQLLSKSKTEQGETARIDIDIYNTGKRIQDVTVEEFLPSSLDIVEIITGDPEIEETENGQKIIWDIGELGEGDERVLSYKIRSKENITAVYTLPASTIKTGDRTITDSNQLEVQLEPSDRDPT